MLLTWALILFCCLLTPFRLVQACSFFPNYICCSLSSSSSGFLDRENARILLSSMAEPSAMNDTLPRSLRILCFGDSLTAGYTRYGWEFHPYADHLRTGLQHMLSASDIHVDVAGLSGDQVRGSYLPRIKRECANAGTPYDWIIVMGGTNDLAWGQSPDTIYEGLRKLSLPLFYSYNLSKAPLPLFLLSFSWALIPSSLEDASFTDSNVTEKVWKVALDTGANVLALNILEAKASSDRGNSERNSLNEKIITHQQKR